MVMSSFSVANPGIGWSENNNDPYPSCSFNYFDCSEECGGNAQIDDCGICSGGIQALYLMIKSIVIMNVLEQRI